MKKKPPKQVCVRMSHKLHERIRSVAYEEETSMNLLMVRYLKAAIVARDAKPGRKKRA